MLQVTEKDSQSHLSTISSFSSKVSHNEDYSQTNNTSSIANRFLSTSQMKVKLPSLAQACDRTGVSKYNYHSKQNAEREKIIKVRSDLKRKIMKYHFHYIVFSLMEERPNNSTSQR